MPYLEKLWLYIPGEHFICHRCKATFRESGPFVRHTIRHTMDPVRFGCSICHMVKSEKSQGDLRNNKHSCYAQNLEFGTVVLGNHSSDLK